MKLLLTSAGLKNDSITKALFDLVGKKPEDTNIVFIPTASNAEPGDKSWVIEGLVNIKKQNFKQIEIVDLAAVPESVWRPKFEEADVLFFDGGATFYLMEWINKSGLAKILPELLKTRVFVGSSAGSMVTNKDLALKISQIIYGEDLDKTENVAGLNYVDFYFLPHLNSEYWPNLRKKNIKEITVDMKEKIYALDDNSAIKVVDEKVEVVSEGEWVEFN